MQLEKLQQDPQAASMLSRDSELGILAMSQVSCAQRTEACLGTQYWPDTSCKGFWLPAWLDLAWPQQHVQLLRVVPVSGRPVLQTSAPRLPGWAGATELPRPWTACWFLRTAAGLLLSQGPGSRAELPTCCWCTMPTPLQLCGDPWMAQLRMPAPWCPCCALCRCDCSLG